MAKNEKNVPKADERRKKHESLLETLESIVVAFILAFIFRAFLVEAFVIPTGSMAPTLLGQHVEHTCEHCRYEYSVGGDEREDRGIRQVVIPPKVVCPNCQLRDRMDDFSLFSGDRILVLKFLYDFRTPERWDVIVFRNPNQPSQNYIKRLVALPGETIQLVRGDVTIDGRIVQKTDKAQEALWMIVHDTRLRAETRDYAPRWGLEEGWTREGPGFRFTQVPETPAWMTYQERDAEGKPVWIGDYYGYNGVSDEQFPGRGRVPVTDLCVTGHVTAEDAGTVLLVEVRAWQDTFLFELTAKGSGRPSRILKNGMPVAESIGGVLPVGQPVGVLAANVDHKLMLWVNGSRPLKALTPLVTKAEGDPIYEPMPVSDDEWAQMAELPDGPARVRVGVRGGPIVLGYLRLDRDVYYTNDMIGGEPGHGVEGNPFVLHEDEFFVMGDNSPRSFDCRLWPLARPVVPRKNLVGKAFFVYWPAAGRRMGIPLAPDVRRFRFVH
jgi:signal peptidase I